MTPSALVQVELGSRSYEIPFGNGLLSEIGERCRKVLKGEKVAVVTDTNVGPYFLNQVEKSLETAGFSVSSHTIPAGEASKLITQAESLCQELAAAGHDRSSAVVALGGGVVGDLAGFVAAIFYRGVPFVQIPTTIVSQVDSAVGGKTGVNLPAGKNLVGAFHQPRLVLIDPQTLLTLPGREFREGFAEVIKHAAIRDAAMLDQLATLDPHDQDVPIDLLARNVAIKARVVEEDEQERSGTRALLNFGHTIGHAIEASVPYGELLHGEAISLGTRAALFLSREAKGLSQADSDRVEGLLARFELPLQLPETITNEQILEKMARDKKFSGKRRTFVVLEKAGHAVTTDDVTDAQIEAAIAHLRLPSPHSK